MHRKLWWLVPLAALVVAAAAVSAACGGDDNGDNGPIAELTDQAGDGGGAATREATEPAAAETPAGGDTTPGAGGGGGGTTINIAAENSTGFTEDSLSAPAGTVTIVFDNQEQGVIHNFTLYDSPDSPENMIDATDLIAGPETAEVTFELEPGEYYFNCQVHPNMEGVLTVE